MNRRSANLLAAAAPTLFREWSRGGGGGGAGGGGGGGGAGGSSRTTLFFAGMAVGAALLEIVKDELEPIPNRPTSQKKGSGAAGAASGALTDPKITAITGGTPPTRLIHRVSDSFVAEFDSLTKNPRWVCERLDRETLKANTAQRGGHSFKEEPGLPPPLRSRLTDYAGWRYDRGHMAPAANHRHSEAAMGDTFYLSNISPQVGPGFNRDYWARFEKFARDCAFRKGVDHCFVVTGPVFAPEWDGKNASRAPPNSINSKRKEDGGSPYQPEVTVERPYAAAPSSSNGWGLGGGGSGGRWVYRHEAVGDALHWVAVPSHFFKVIVCCDDKGKAVSFGAFMMPNEAIAPSTRLEEFVVPLSVLESLTGLKFFSELLPSSSNAFKAELEWDREETTGGAVGGAVGGVSGDGFEGSTDINNTTSAARSSKAKGGKAKAREELTATDDEEIGLFLSSTPSSSPTSSSTLSSFSFSSSASSSMLRANVQRMLTRSFPGPWSHDAFPFSSNDSINDRSFSSSSASRPLRHLCTQQDGAGGCSAGAFPPENWFAAQTNTATVSSSETPVNFTKEQTPRGGGGGGGGGSDAGSSNNRKRTSSSSSSSSSSHGSSSNSGSDGGHSHSGKRDGSSGSHNTSSEGGNGSATKWKVTTTTTTSDGTTSTSTSTSTSRSDGVDLANVILNAAVKAATKGALDVGGSSTSRGSSSGSSSGSSGGAGSLPGGSSSGGSAPLRLPPPS